MLEVLLFVIMLVVVLGILGLMASWAKYVEWQEGVKRSRVVRADIMSLMHDAAFADPPSSLEDGRETDVRRTQPRLPGRIITAQELLTLYQLMRRYNIPREEAAVAFKAVDLPFNNNVWAKAAPEGEPQVTPIAHRPTAAKFHDDPELEYQPLR